MLLAYMGHIYDIFKEQFLKDIKYNKMNLPVKQWAKYVIRTLKQ